MILNDSTSGGEVVQQRLLAKTSCFTKMHVSYLVLLMASFYSTTKCSNILALVPVNSRSHFIVMEPLFKALALRGHQVTVVSPFPQNKPLMNYIDIDISNLLPTKGQSFSLDTIKRELQVTWNLLQLVSNIGYNTCQMTYEDDRIKALMNSSQKFDLVITEIFSSDCFVLFAHKFDVPLISIVTSVSLPWANDRIGNPDNPSYIVNYFHDFAFPMTFYERLLNTGMLIFTKLGFYYYGDSVHSKLMHKYFGDNIPELDEIYNERTALVLVNSHFTVNQPRPLVPNFIEIGGIHLQQPNQLPQDIQEILDKASDGFILFSMGTLVNMTTMPDHIIISFLDAFSSLGNIVLWKYEGKLPYNPSNVITRKWLPQKEILVHKNLKIFITHGGLSSTLEAVNAGVPVLGIPMFADQKGNIMNIVRRGAGILMDYDSITENGMFTSLNKIIGDKSFKENAMKLSELFKDRPQSPLESAVFWTEHVLRHNGAPHMRSAAAGLPLYKLLLLDVILVVLAASTFTCFLLYKLTVFSTRFLTKNSITNSKRVSKNKKSE